MNNRLKKKAEKRRRAEVLRVFELALGINGLNGRKQDETGNLPTIIFSFSGHVGRMSVDVFPEGWAHDCEKISYNAYTDREMEAYECYKVRDIIHELEKLQKSKDPEGGHPQSQKHNK